MYSSDTHEHTNSWHTEEWCHTKRCSVYTLVCTSVYTLVCCYSRQRTIYASIYAPAGIQKSVATLNPAKRQCAVIIRLGNMNYQRASLVESVMKYGLMQLARKLALLPNLRAIATLKDWPDGVEGFEQVVGV